MIALRCAVAGATVLSLTAILVCVVFAPVILQEVRSARVTVARSGYCR